MLEGKCSKCGYHCFGWALREQRSQSCPICGTALEIKEGDRVFTGYSPFTAEEYKIKSPNKTTSTPESEKGSQVHISDT
jgi:ssDNA-binding Zn-finger/Zn-ribbon topoisomerase 1